TVGSMWLSLKPADFSLSNIACLTQHLRQSHRGWGRVTILFFTSFDAAANFSPETVEDTPGIAFGREMYVMYAFDESTHEEYFSIMPTGYTSGINYFVAPDVLLSGNIHCSMSVSDRCAVVLPDMEYPAKAFGKRASGQITLTGTIAPDGS